MQHFRQSGITVKLLPQRMHDNQGGVFPNFMMVFGMTQPGREPTTYSVRGGHANRYGNKPSRRVFFCFIRITIHL